MRNPHSLCWSSDTGFDIMKPLWSHLTGASSLQDSQPTNHIRILHKEFAGVSSFSELTVGYLRILYSSVGIAECYGLDSRCSIPGLSRRFICTQHCPDRSRVHQVSYLTGTAGKAAGTQSWPVTSIWCGRQESWSCTLTPPCIFLTQGLIN